MYYISLYNSNNKLLGYNLSQGGDNQSVGENNGRALLNEQDIINIRTLRANFKTKNEVYKLYEDRITLNGFTDIWQGRRWHHIKVDGVYSEEIKDFQKSLRGGRGSNAKLQDDEVFKIRKRYVNETVKQIYEDYKDLYSSIKSFESVVHGRSYSHLPIYKKKQKLWINK